MSQITLTNQERIEAVERLGYTAREASFLTLAGLHSGFFLRRQFCQFIGKEVGGTAAAFIGKLRAKEHGSAVTGFHNCRIYHISARPFYAALGQEDNRNRRDRPFGAIKNKLMCLDFVLENPAYRYFPTEQEKVDYFTRTLGIGIADLPTKLYRSPQAKEPTLRFFVDKCPIYISEEPLRRASPTFCFIDEGMITGAKFESYLNQYRRLFARLESFEVVYVASNEASFAAVKRSFRTFFPDSRAAVMETSNAVDVERLLAHFIDRHLYESGQHDSFDRVKLIQFRNARQNFKSDFFEILYRKWSAGDAPAVREMLAPQQTFSPAGARFRTYLLRNSYDVFGT